MHPVREQLRRLLTRDEQALDDWLHALCNMEVSADDHERVAIESIGFGLWFRSMAIAAKNPGWNFFRVLAEAKRSTHAKVSVAEIIRKANRRN